MGGRAGLKAVLGGGQTTLHAGISRRGRFPALRELYSGALNRFVPNPDLEPEKLLTIEAGATMRMGHGGVLQSVAFHHFLDDAVVRITVDDGSGRFMRVNRDQLETTGLELMAAYGFGSIEVSATCTAQSIELTDTEARKTNRPENLPEAFGDLSVRFPVFLGLVGRGRVDYTGEQYAIDAITGEDTKLAAQAVMNASISRTWSIRAPWRAGAFSILEARLALDNVGDVALYDAWGLPEPERRFRLELQLR